MPSLYRTRFLGHTSRFRLAAAALPGRQGPRPNRRADPAPLTLFDPTMPPTSFDIGFSLNPCPRKLGAPYQQPPRRLRPSVANDRLRYMLIGYARVSKTDGSQSLDLQRDALRAEGIDAVNLYHDFASGVRDDRPGLDSCLRALRKGDVLVAWKLDRLGRNLAHLVNTAQDLSARGVGLRVLAGQGAQIDTTTAAGRLVFGIFAALAEFERELIRERTVAGLKAARARGRKGGRKFALSKAQVRLAQAAMAHCDTSVSELCRQLGIRPVTLYRYVGPQGQLREQGQKVLAS